MTENVEEPRRGGLHVVFGAGPVGLAVADELSGRGRRVRLVNRSGRAAAPEGVEVVGGDATDKTFAREASAGASDVYLALNPPYHRWAQEFPAMTDNVVEGAAGAKLVFADNLYMYGPGAPQPMTEETPQKAQGKKGKTRILMAERLLDAHRSGRARVAIGRSSDYYGPRGTGTIAGDTVFGAALAGKTVRWPGSLDAPHTFTYLPDMACALVTLGERAEADGGVWHLPAADPITGRRFLDLVSGETGRPVKASATYKTALRVVGVFSPFVRELTETVYQFEGPFVSDASRFGRVFGPFDPTPHPEAVARTVAWFRGQRG